jgi:hypothetical protein
MSRKQVVIKRRLVHEPLTHAATNEVLTHDAVSGRVDVRRHLDGERSTDSDTSHQ